MIEILRQIQTREFLRVMDQLDEISEYERVEPDLARYQTWLDLRSLWVARAQIYYLLLTGQELSVE